MSFAVWLGPSADLIAESRAAGASGLTEPSSFSLTPVTTRIVAVACATVENRGVAGMADGVASAAAARNSMDTTANALPGEW